MPGNAVIGAGRDPELPIVVIFLDYSLRSPFGPPFGRSTRYALLSGLRRNNEDGVCIGIFCLSKRHYDWITLYCVPTDRGEYEGISNAVEEVRLRVKRRLRR